MTKVTYVRAVELPGGARMHYEIRGDHIVVTVQADGGSEEMVRVAQAMWTEILNLHMQPKTRLRLITNCERQVSG